MNGYIENLNEILLKWGEHVAERIKTNLDTTNTTASGKTKQSVEVVVGDGELTIYGRPFFQGVETGRGAGKIPYKFTDIIRQWMTDKGIEDRFGDKEWQKRNAAYLIAQKIKNEGSRLYRNGGRDDIYTNVLDEELPELEKQILYSIQQSLLRDIQ